jgi:CubicO group peptidase (beta-lactamase class C family)
MNTVAPEKVGFSPSRLDHVRTVMQSYVDKGKLPGAVTLIARRGQVAHAECVGMRDIEARKPMQLDTLFPIYSMTKPITAVAMMILYEEGKYQLYDPLSRFIPEFKDVKVILKTNEAGMELTGLEREITIRDLLTQTSGFVSGGWSAPPLTKLVEEIDLYRPDNTLQEFTQKLVKLPLIHQPGKGWRYGESPEVLGYLVELLSGMPFDAFLKQRIFEPLGMDDTDFSIPEAKRDRLARMYGFSETGSLVEKVESSPWLVPSSVPRGGFGLISTAPDYLRFAQMLLNKGELDDTRILGRMTVEYMTRNHLPKELLPMQVFPGMFLNGYGYGFLLGVLVDPVQAGLLGSEGEFYWGGLNTIFWIDPKEELFALLMTYLEWPNHVPIYYDFRTLTYQSIVD